MKYQCIPQALVQLLWIYLLLFTGLAQGADRKVRGFILYARPPTTYAEFVEYSTQVPTRSDQYKTIIARDGTTRELQTGGILTDFKYPDGPASNAAEQIQLLQGLEGKYPQYRQQFEAAITKWKNAAAANPTARPPARLEPITLTNGVTYQNPEITAVDAATVTIVHEDGSIKVAWGLLPPQVQKALEKQHEEAVQRESPPPPPPFSPPVNPPAPAPVAPSEPAPLWVSGSQPPIDSKDPRAAYRALAEIATDALTANGSQNLRAAGFSAPKLAHTGLGQFTRLQSLLKTSDPGFRAAAQRVQSVYFDYYRLEMLDKDFGGPSTRASPRFLAPLERMWSISLNDYEQRVVTVQSDGARDTYVDHDDQGEMASENSGRSEFDQYSRKMLEEHRRGEEFSKHVALARTILDSQMEDIWTTQLLPHLQPPGSGSEARLVSISSPSSTSGNPLPGGLRLNLHVENNQALTNCLLTANFGDHFGDHASWHGYLTKILPSDEVVIEGAGIDAETMLASGGTMEGAFTFYCNEGSQSKTPFTLSSSLASSDRAAAQNAELHKALKAKIEVASALVARARRRYPPPGDPVLAHAGLMAAIHAANKYVAQADNGNAQFSLTFRPFNPTSTRLEAELDRAGGGTSGVLIGKFEEEMSRGCVLALTDAKAVRANANAPVPWLATEPREILERHGASRDEEAPALYVIFLDAKGQLAVQMPPDANGKISAAHLVSPADQH